VPDLPWHTNPRSVRYLLLTAAANALVAVLTFLGPRHCGDCGGRRQHEDGCPHAPRSFTAAH
jgi:hypothetical protein